MSASVTCRQAAEWLRERDGFLLLTHRRPDGDTLGCAAGLCRALRRLGKTAWILPNEDANALFTPYLEGLEAPAQFVPEHVVSLDIASEGLFPASAAPYRGRVALAIDHHPSNEGFAALNCVEPDKASCGEIVYNLVSTWLPVDAQTALPLYVAVSTDTGCFVYSNTTPHTHRVAAALMETGIDFRAVNKRHFRTKSRKRLLIEARMLETMEFFDGGETALSFVLASDMARLQATSEDIDDIAAFTGQLEGVRTAVTIREVGSAECKISVRTQPGINASQVCALLGGGGHAAAAGCSVKGSVAEARRAVLEAIARVRSHSLS